MFGRKIAFALLTCCSVAAVARYDVPLVDRDDPIVKGALERSVPRDPVDLLEARVLLRKLQFYGEAEAVGAVMERSMLFQLLGKPAPFGQPLETAMKQASKQDPTNAGLRARIFASMKLSLPDLKLEDEPIDIMQSKVGDFPHEGGEWTRRLAATQGYFYVPVRVVYSGPKGFVKGMRGEVRLLPAKSGKSILLAVHDNLQQKHEDLHQRAGKAFWLRAHTSSRNLTTDELRHAIEGLKSGAYRLKAEWMIVYLSLSEDPTKPYIEVGPDGSQWSVRGPRAHWERYFDPPIPAFALMGPEQKCLANAERQADAVQTGPHMAAAPTGASDHLAEPDSPLVRNILEKRLPRNPADLIESVALLSALNYRVEAERLLNFTDRSVLEEMLGRPFKARRSIAAALESEPATESYLQALRMCVLSHAVSAHIPEAESAKVEGILGLKHDMYEGDSVWSHLLWGKPHLTVPVVVTNMAKTGFLAIEFDVRLVPATTGEPIVLQVSRTGGTVIDPGKHHWMGATVAPDAVSVARLKQAINGEKDKQFRIETTVREAAFYPRGDRRPTLELSLQRTHWNGLHRLVGDAQQEIAAANCTEKGNCTKARSGGGLSNPYIWIVAQTVLTLLPLLLIPQKKSAHPVIWGLYAVYWSVVLLITLFAFVDRPTGHGWSGFMTIVLAYFAGVPWSSAFAGPGFVHSTISQFFKPNDAALISMWLAIGINQALLGLLAFRSRRPRGGNDGTPVTA